MLYSSEARWFVSGTSFEDILRWFISGTDCSPKIVQEHEYLALNGCTSTGVKLREGRFEIKALRAVPHPFTLEESITGIVEEWVKWSFASGELHKLSDSLHESGSWLKVSKERFLRRYTPQAGGLVEISATERTFGDVGCNIEVTAVEVDGKPGLWTTCAFEAFGPISITGRILSQALHQFFQERGPIPGVPLTENQSFGYPTWLSSITSP